MKKVTVKKAKNATISLCWEPSPTPGAIRQHVVVNQQRIAQVKAGEGIATISLPAGEVDAYILTEFPNGIVVASSVIRLTVVDQNVYAPATGLMVDEDSAGAMSPGSLFGVASPGPGADKRGKEEPVIPTGDISPEEAKKLLEDTLNK